MFSCLRIRVGPKSLGLRRPKSIAVYLLHDANVGHAHIAEVWLSVTPERHSPAHCVFHATEDDAQRPRLISSDAPAAAVANGAESIVDWQRSTTDEIEVLRATSLFLTCFIATLFL